MRNHRQLVAEFVFYTFRDLINPLHAPIHYEMLTQKSYLWLNIAIYFIKGTSNIRLSYQAIIV